MNGRAGGAPSSGAVVEPATLVSRPPFFCHPAAGPSAVGVGSVPDLCGSEEAGGLRKAQGGAPSSAVECASLSAHYTSRWKSSSGSSRSNVRGRRSQGVPSAPGAVRKKRMRS